MPASFQIAPETPGSVVGMMITLAVPERVELPDTDRVVIEVVAPRVPLTVTAPVVLLIVISWKPFCDRTGPVKVLLAMIPHMRVMFKRSVCMSSAGTVRTPETPELDDVVSLGRCGVNEFV